MNIFFIHPFKIRREPVDKHSPVHRTPIHDTSEGSEFLDDAIYREDVQETPESYIEESKPIDNKQ